MSSAAQTQADAVTADGGAGVAVAAPSSVERSVADIADEELLRRAVMYARPRGGYPKWAIVAQMFGLGSTYSVQLCRRFGIDPNEIARRK